MTVARSRGDSSGTVAAEVFDRITDGVFVVDRDWTYVFANPAGAAFVGLTPSDLVGRNIWTVFPKAVGSHFERACRLAMDQRKPVEFEQRGEEPDQWSAIRVFPADEGLTIYYEDVSEQRRSERDIRRLAAIVEASDDAVVSQTLDGVVLTWNAAAERIFGYGADEMIGTPIISLTQPDQLFGEQAVYARVNAGEYVEHQLARRVRKDGDVIEVSLSVFPVRDDTGAVVGSAAIVRDMTGQRLAERLLADVQMHHAVALALEAQLARKAEARLRGILDGMSEGVIETTLEGKFVTVNRAYASILGYESPEELMADISDTTTLYVDPDARLALIARATEVGLVRADIELRGRDGKTVWVRSRICLRQEAGEVIGMLVIAEDITAGRTSELKIREAEERLRFAFHDSPMPLGIIEFTATGGVISETNTALESLLGYGPGDLVGADVDSFVPAEGFGSSGNVIEPFEGDSVRVAFETCCRHRDGHWVPVALTVVTVQSAAGTWYATAAVEDITARRTAEADRESALRLVETRAGTQAALADLARLTLESADIGTFGRTACGLVARLLEVDFCAILLPGDDEALRVVSEWGWDRRLLATVDNAPAPDSQAAHTLRHGVSVIVDDWLTETRFTRSPLLEAHDVHSGLTVAIRYDQSTIGAIGVQSRAPRRFDDAAVRVLESVAQLVGVAIEQDRVQHRLAQSERTLQAIVDNAPVAIHVVDPEGRFLLVNRELERIIGMPRDLLVGKTRAEVPRLADGTPVAVLIDDLDARRHPTSIAVERTTTEADGEHSYLSVNFPLLDGDGQTYGMGGISTEVTELVRSRAETTSAWLESMDRLAKAVEFRDDSTGAHIERMAAYSDLIARLLGFPGERCAQIRAAAPMHDIGKMAIPDHVLLKPGPFTPEERMIMNAHADLGFRLLTGSGSAVLELAATIALSHHERFDGTGYPHGLIGTDIPVEGRIVAIADSFDALTSDRVYRSAMPIDTAIEVMEGEIGHFDPEILALFIRNLDLAKRVWASFHLPAAAVRLDALAAAAKHADQRPTERDHALLT